MKSFLVALTLILNSILSCKSDNCGIVKYGKGGTSGGRPVERGEFPFAVALVKTINREYFCSGVLMNEAYMLTAAYCINDKDENVLQTEDVIALLGKFDLNAKTETKSLERRIQEIAIHENWKTNTGNSNADIAILFFEKPIKINPFVNIICLPKSLNMEQLRPGVVIGWNKDEGTVEKTPWKVQMDKIVPNKECIGSYATTISSRSFCGSSNNERACIGSFGAGYYFEFENRWYLQGIVSSANDASCDSAKPVVFTKISSYYDWIWEKTTKFKSMILQCCYDVSYKLKSKPYMCAAKNLEVLTDTYKITSAEGFHLNSKTNLDVQLLDLGSKHHSIKKEIHFIPNKIGTVFPNLKILYIQNCKLSSIKRRNFENLDLLSTISLTNNLIDHIDSDAFYDLPNLFSLRINQNKLVYLSPKLLMEAPKLQHIKLSNNLLQTIEHGIFDENNQLKTLDLYGNKLQNIDIKLSKFKLLTEVDLRKNDCVDKRYLAEVTDALDKIQEIIDEKCSNLKS